MHILEYNFSWQLVTNYAIKQILIGVYFQALAGRQNTTIRL